MPEDIPPKSSPNPEPITQPEAAPIIDLGPGPGINIGEEFGNRTNAINGVRTCRRFAFGIGHAETLGPDNLLVIDDGDGERR